MIVVVHPNILHATSVELPCTVNSRNLVQTKWHDLPAA